eukprot:TRINITY_DN15388_c0_g1_i3.p1 TRINITY_DN15388_c0_g1~~TRINITY_DN15388_c0_g1_i3.p1  ORF type:complete len:311 (+),score=59.76 TRINITY_DN15388_c0_g1_i3:114-935(+)
MDQTVTVTTVQVGDRLQLFPVNTSFEAIKHYFGIYVEGGHMVDKDDLQVETVDNNGPYKLMIDPVLLNRHKRALGITPTPKKRGRPPKNRYDPRTQILTMSQMPIQEERDHTEFNPMAETTKREEEESKGKEGENGCENPKQPQNAFQNGPAVRVEEEYEPENSDTPVQGKRCRKTRVIFEPPVAIPRKRNRAQAALQSAVQEPTSKKRRGRPAKNGVFDVQPLKKKLSPEISESSDEIPQEFEVEAILATGYGPSVISSSLCADSRFPFGIQ